MNSNNDDLIKEITKRVMMALEECNAMVPVGISNRHVHISRGDLDILFGKDYQLKKFKDLKQPGQYASKETVTIIGSKGNFENVRILGPVRNETQVEISLSDSFKLGINPPVTESGKLNDTPGIAIVGPLGKVRKDRGVIAALRHIHMPVETAKFLGLKDKEMVDVEVNGIRKSVMGNVLVRVSDKYELEIHVDTDEANGSCLKNGDLVKIII
jgi:putative phosphotransacetylase